MTEPVKVTAPMNTPRKVSTRRMETSTGVLCAITAAKPVSALRAVSSIPATLASSRWVLKPMNTAARPTRLCIAATSCGISVICTRCATTQPMAPPTAIITTEISQLPAPGP